ncbi:PH domain-containing protein [Candidatus Nanohalobium constans]|uniref:Putative membrane protein n=1 Tax=Candidatus Nanohalobium constans TaxID=2565781 RepID=A0A5Q0UET6_9ARCH|nr:PH domain-containing protein [Candidatus Nanohalobium constans]QGA80056.1 putative membrane protein [Candidatus Nanohalobium constans]
MEPEGGLHEGESVKKHFTPSPWKYLGWYLLGLILLPLMLIGVIVWIIAEIHRKGHKYFITNERVIREFKFLSRDTTEATFDLITETSIDQPLGYRMLNIGDVNVKTASGQVIEFGAIPNPKNAKNQITEAKHRDKNEVQKVEMVENGDTEYCQDCGEEVSSSSTYCSSCGHKIEKEQSKKEEKSIDYSTMLKGSIQEVKDDIKALEDPDYAEIIEEEKQNKERKTLIEWLEGKEE